MISLGDVPSPPLAFDPQPDPPAELSTADVVALAALGPEAYLEGRPLQRGVPDAGLTNAGATAFEGLRHVGGNEYAAEWSGPFG